MYYGQAISLPMYPGLTSEDVARVVDCVIAQATA